MGSKVGGGHGRRSHHQQRRGSLHQQHAQPRLSQFVPRGAPHRLSPLRESSNTQTNTFSLGDPLSPLTETSLTLGVSHHSGNLAHHDINQHHGEGPTNHYPNKLSPIHLGESSLHHDEPRGSIIMGDLGGGSHVTSGVTSCTSVHQRKHNMVLPPVGGRRGKKKKVEILHKVGG